MNMGDRIRFVRQFRGLTQLELAEAVGLPPGENGRIRISQYEHGVYVPKEDMLEKISEALGVTSLYLSTKEHTYALDLAFGLLEWDRVTDFKIKEAEKDEGKSHYDINFNTNYFDDFFKEWMRKKADLKNGKISEEDYIEWTINLKF